MNKERGVIIALLALLVVTNIGWFYLGRLPTDGSTPNNEFENRLQELRNEKTSVRLLYEHSFEEYRQTVEGQGYEFTEVNWGTFKERLDEYEERQGTRAVTIHPDDKAFDIPGLNTTYYYYQVE